MAQKAVIGFILTCFITYIAAESVMVTGLEGNGICKDNIQRTRFILRSLTTLTRRLENCVVVVGNLQINLELTEPQDFINVSFPNLKEITGYFVMYRVRGLDSIGQLLPNLSRIRGTELLNNYALIIYDMFNLTEIGLYNLLKIDRGGVIIWEVPQACFVNTVNWRVIAPRSRHVIAPSERQAHCNFPCTCNINSSPNYCWNNKMCQLYVEGPDRMDCSEQCFGCKRTKNTSCFLCKHYTYRLQCLSQCPKDTLVLEDSNYCVNLTECENMDGWEFEGTCVFKCPINYLLKKDSTNRTHCQPCIGCHQICRDQIIQTTATIQMAENCVHINGSLEIHIRANPDAMEELQRLRHIQEVSDYVLIYGSLTIKSLNFLSGLRRIGGRNLKSERYSLVIHDMKNLRGLLLENVTKNLIIDKGSVQIYGNQKLCASDIDKIRERFPVKPDDVDDIPKGSNGYGGVCDEVLIDIQTRVLNETTAAVLFPISNPGFEYAVLYARLAPENLNIRVPETCSDAEWISVDVPINSVSKFGLIELTSLRPASNYALCIEIHDPLHGTLARSNIFNFTTLTGTPEPPFITELVASSFDVVVLRWLDHEDYRSRITHYQLEVILIEAHQSELDNINYCTHVIDDEPLTDYDRHAVVMRPPPEYGKSCESMCGVLSSVTEGALANDFFDVCSSIDFDCNIKEDSIFENSTFKNYVKTLVLEIKNHPKEGFQVGQLAPYRDYSFKLRACAHDKCSRSARGVVKTLRSENADIPIIKNIYAYDTGLMTVLWEHPLITNGPILSYSIEVLPKMGYNLQLLPQEWCVFSSESSYTLQSIPASKYKVRVCSRTLASANSCTDWIVMASTKLQSQWWSGLSFGVLLFVVSVLNGFFRRNRDRTDRQRLIEEDVIYLNETNPPIALID